MTQTEDTAEDPRLALARRFFAVVPHGRALGIEPVAVADNRLVAELPYRDEIVGNPETGVVHGGVITTLVDQTSGASVVAAAGQAEPVATLDLRIDYLRPAAPGITIRADAECYRLTDNIAFVRCLVHQGDPDRPIATSMSTFMRTQPNVSDLSAGEAP